MRYNFFQYAAPGEKGVGFFEVDGFNRPVRGICYSPDQTYQGSTMDEYHNGWMLTPPDHEGFALPSPPTSEEEALEAERLMALGGVVVRKLRRRIEDALRKGGAFGVVRIADALQNHISHLNLFDDSSGDL